MMSSYIFYLTHVDVFIHLIVHTRRGRRSRVPWAQKFRYLCYYCRNINCFGCKAWNRPECSFVCFTYCQAICLSKAFDRVWHTALWVTMKKSNISAYLIRAIKNFYYKATSAVLFKCSVGDWFRTTVGVRQGCLLTPTLFNILLERS